MDQEILQTLQEIRGILFFSAYIFGIGVFFWVLRSISIIMNNLKELTNKDWRSEAHELYDKGKYDDLIKHCEHRKTKYPNDAKIYYWLGRAYKQKGNDKTANVNFLKVREIEPSWDEEFVQPYISPGSNEYAANKAN